MSDIIKSIIVKDNHVFISSYPEGSVPSDAFRYEATDYTQMLRKHGIEAVLKEIAHQCLIGNYLLENSSSTCRYLNQALKLLKQNRRLDKSLDENSISGFMAHCVIKWWKNPWYQPTAELSRLEAQRIQKGHVYVHGVDYNIKPGIDSVVQNASKKAAGREAVAHTAPNRSEHTNRSPER